MADTPAPAIMRASMEIRFDYTRSLGPVLGPFMTALRDRRIIGARAADGRVHAPPFEFDPVTASPPDALFEVGPAGTVVSWTWMSEPLDGQPLDRPFGWALIRLDGADTAMLHAVDPGPGGHAGMMRTGMRVRPRWADERVGSIRDIACFEPDPADTAEDTCGPVASAKRALPAQAAEAADTAKTVVVPGPVTMTIAPVRLRYQHTASLAESAYLRGLAEGRLIGQRCPACGLVYIPSRGTCPADGVTTDTEVDLPDTGTVTTFSIVNVAYPGQHITPPYAAAAILLDGADIAFHHLVLGCDPGEVRMGMRVKAVWKPRGAAGGPGSGDSSPDSPPTTPGNAHADTISHFAPTGEPDASYETYGKHL